MKKRFHLLIVIGVILVGFIIGSFFDLQIDQAIFQRNNGFGLFMASFGVYPCYACFAFVGGALLISSIKRKELPNWVKIISYVLSGVIYVMAVYLAAKEMPSANGYNNEKLTIVSYAVAAVVFAGCFVGGVFACKNRDNLKQIWVLSLVIVVIFTVALLPAGFLIKLVIHRPRYRLAVNGELTSFYNWWQMFPEYKNYISSPEHPIFVNGVEVTKEEFKSFPSGHSGTGMIMAMFLPFAAFFFPKLKGKEIILFYIGAAWGFLMMFSRLLVGAHYLTDTCMGSLICMVTFYVVNEFAIHKKLYDIEEKAIEAKEEPAPIE
jgi:membrane-associated phospholipid phosphatase